jgi:hypothetical protein
MPRWLLKALTPLLAVVLFLGGLLLLGRLTRDWLAQQDRATFALVNTDCPAPPGQPAADFVSGGAVPRRSARTRQPPH